MPLYKLVAAVSTPAAQTQPDWALVASITVAIAAVIGLVLREWQRSRQDLDKKVRLAVDAALGSTFQQFREAERSVREQLNKTIEDIQRGLHEQLDRASQQTTTLSEMLPVAQQLQTVLERAEGMLPSVDSTIPAVLLQQARSTNDYATMAAILTQVLDSSASSIELEAAGDLARQQLNNTTLAERLYAAATAKDPQRPTARAEHLAIRVIQGGEQRPELLDELRSLASDNMENRFVVGRLFDIYIETDAYRQMHDFCVDALDTMPNSPILHRNLAISLHRLGRDEDEVVAAFENAMEVARRYNEGRVNTIRPYLAYLVDKAISVEHESAKTELLDRARQLVVEGLRLEPTEAQLYMQLGRILAEERDDAAAKAIVAIGVKYASPTERIVLNDQLLRLNALSELQGLIPSLSAERLQQASRSPVVILDATDEQQGSEPV